MSKPHVHIFFFFCAEEKQLHITLNPNIVRPVLNLASILDYFIKIGSLCWIKAILIKFNLVT